MNIPQSFVLFIKNVAHTRYCGRRPFSTSPIGQSEIAGTAPPYQYYVFLHSSVPPSVFPAKVMSPLQRALQMKLVRRGGFVNWVWYEDFSSSSKIQSPVDPRHDSSDSHSATVFTSSGERIEIPHLSLSNIDEVEESLLRRVENAPERQPIELPEELHLFVCTHTERDCRCGEQGGQFSRALKEEVKRRCEFDSSGIYSRVRIGEVAHVGQHRYAPNLLVYPRGDWLGLLKKEDVPTILDQVIESSTSPSHEIVFPKANWRGRMSLSQEEQLRLYSA